MSKRIIYLVYACDAWKTTSSMRLVMATTSVRRVKSCVAQGILDGRWNYRDGEGWVEKDQAKMFRKDFDVRTRPALNDDLTYCYLDYVYDGEEC